MEINRFKIGDKVRFRSEESGCGWTGRTGTVNRLDPASGEFITPGLKVFMDDVKHDILCCESEVDLIDDRPDPFPPMAAEVSSDTPTDRTRDAALREVDR